MALFEDHLYNGTYPYLTPEEFIARCPIAKGAMVTDFEVIEAVQDASLAMYYLTGKQFAGTSTTTLRLNCECGCGFCSSHRLHLGLWPVTSITSVREEGVVHPGSEYHVDEFKYIVKNNGEPFPRSSNPYAVTGGVHDNAEDGWVFEVTFVYGIAAPPLLKRATAALACSLYADSVDRSDACALPERVTSITRNGMSMEINDFVSLMERGSTGIYAVDLAVRIWNPSGLQSPSFVWSPDQKSLTRAFT